MVNVEYTFFSILVSFLTIRGFRFELTEDGLALANTQNFAWLPVFLFFVWVIYRNFNDTDRRLKFFSGVFGLIICTFYTLGLSFEKIGTFSWVLENRKYLINFANYYFSYSVLYYCFAYLTFQFIRKKTIKASKNPVIGFSLKRVFLYWFLLILAYIPWYLYCYPGIVTNDSADQLRMALFLMPQSNHHPYFLTLLIRGILFVVNQMTGSYQIGVGVCSLLQMLFLTFVFSLTFERIRVYISNRVLLCIVFIWFAFYPVNSMYSVTLWKDILFSACLLLLLLCVDFITENAENFFRSGKKCCFLFLILLVLPLSRHNGIAITFVMTVVLLYQFPAYRRRLIMICCSSLFIFAFFQYLILPVLNVKKVDSGLSLSIPCQQIARTLYYHNQEIPAEDLEKIEAYFNKTEFWKMYRAKNADRIKDGFKNELFVINPLEFIKQWFYLGVRYPVDYLEAFFHNNYGYWFPETNYWITDYGVANAAEEFGVYSAPILKMGIIDKIYNFQMSWQFNKIPVLSLLFKPGACWWVWIYCGIYCLYQNKHKIILLVPGFVLWITLLFSPIYCEFRYAYGLFIGIPLIIVSTKILNDR